MQCNAPFYAGNDILCAQDSDQDGRSDIKLECADETCEMVCTCNSCSYISIPCALLQDVCPLIFNPNQDAIACDPAGPGNYFIGQVYHKPLMFTIYAEGGCPIEIDLEFQIMWPSSRASTNATNTCRGGTGNFKYLTNILLSLQSQELHTDFVIQKATGNHQ